MRRARSVRANACRARSRGSLMMPPIVPATTMTTLASGSATMRPGIPATAPPTKIISTAGSGCRRRLRPTVNGMNTKSSSTRTIDEQRHSRVDNRRLGRKIGGGDQHHDRAPDDRPDQRNPGEHRGHQPEGQRAGDAERRQAGRETCGVDERELEQALEVGAGGGVHALDHIQRAFEVRVGHRVAQEFQESPAVAQEKEGEKRREQQ